VNLALGVAPPEPAGAARAGWHRICSWMSAIDLHDDVVLTPRAGVADAPFGSSERFTLGAEWAHDAPRPSPIDWPPEKDLCVRALDALDRLLAPRGVRVPPVHVRVHKRVPVGGGLGGGSSDAAATLLLARVLIEESSGPGSAPADDLRRAARSIGSDVEFFLDDDAPLAPPRPAIVSGFGDEIERVPPLALRLVLLLPGVGCPTREVYRAYDASSRPLDEPRVRTLARSSDPGAIAAGAFNDLAEPAARAVPTFGSILARARAALPAPVHVSGSGSSMFVVARNEVEQASLLAAARSLEADVVALPVRTL
jgi:4-diphosphocytidyl-2-C-methyl-D-erythritol kinase